MNTGFSSVCDAWRMLGLVVHDVYLVNSIFYVNASIRVLCDLLWYPGVRP